MKLLGLGLAVAVGGAGWRTEPLAAQQRAASVVGTIVERNTQTPLAAATILLLGTDIRMRSDGRGRFTQTGLAPGKHVLHAVVPGYAPATWTIELREGEVLERLFHMDVASYELPGIVATAPRERWRAEFERRRLQGPGHFITQEQIAARDARSLADLLRAVPGVRIACRQGGCAIVMSRAPRECRPEYYLDGLPASFSTTPDMPVFGIAGIEVYRTRSEAPLEFLKADNRCGTVVIWTKTGP